LNDTGLRGILVYSLVYVFANIRIWATVLMLRRHEYAGERVDDFEGLHRRQPFIAFCMVVFLLSLGGIPPTAGFIGKYFLFDAAGAAAGDGGAAVSDNDKTNWDALAEGWALAILFPAAIGAGFLIGLGADKLFGIGPWGKAAGTGLGIIAAFVQLFRVGLRKD